MNFLENLREASRSIQGNVLRTILTAAIIAVGIFCLVGILTAIDAIQNSVNNNLASLGANTFEVKSTQPNRRQRRGVEEKRLPPIHYEEAVTFKERFASDGAVITLSALVSAGAELKHLSKKTNPNITLMGIDENYVAVKAYNLAKGRNFSNAELMHGINVAVLGSEVAETLFDKENPVGKNISAAGNRFKVIGVLEKSGSVMGGGGADRLMLVPMETSRVLSGSRTVTYDITAALRQSTDAGNAMGEATGLMRLIRHDKPGEPESFEVVKSDSLSSSLDEIAGFLRMGGGIIGLITLLGASIGLMNIMLVSVTERTREIGVRKALGATPARIRQQFLLEAIVICLLGGLVGILLGIAGGNLAAVLLNSGSFVIPWVWMLLGLVVCVAVGLASGYYPAYRASKLDPIEALRFE
jgi:putative ABC transport system permease protein